MNNNPAENAIRLSVIGRKNWLFYVSEAGVTEIVFDMAVTLATVA